MGSLTTHVLNTAQGKPGAGIRVDVYAMTPHQRLVKSVYTNREGRCDTPLLDGDQFHTGVWELVFHLGVYFAQSGLPLPDPPFLDTVAIRFGIAAEDEHYHVPLLVSPWGYTTYRGS